MRRKVGLGNLFFGVLELLIGLPLTFFIVPDLLTSYESMKVELTFDPNIYYFFSVILLLHGILSFLSALGNMNFIFKSKPTLVYRVGLFLFITSIILTVLIVYSLASSFFS